MSFALDERLAADALVVGDMTLTRVLLMNDARWPWLILVPRRDGARRTDRSRRRRPGAVDRRGGVGGSRFLKAHTGAHKINLGALGNVVRQFHLHVVARTVGDPAWPGPVWGLGAAVAPRQGEARTLIEAARAGLAID